MISYNYTKLFWYMWICIVLYIYQVLVKFIIQSAHLAQVEASVQSNIFLYGKKNLKPTEERSNWTA